MSFVPYIHQPVSINLGFSIKNICKTKTDFNIIYNHSRIRYPRSFHYLQGSSSFLMGAIYSNMTMLEKP